MKATRISVLIFSVIAGLVLLCVVFPTEGIDLGFAELKFPTLVDALRGDTTKYIDPEEQMAQIEREQMALQHAKADANFLKKINKSDARIWFPGDKAEYFDPLFAALDNAKEEHMRIIHYGDSQIELDRISSTLREVLQAKFGGHGKGWIPVVQRAGNYTVTSSCSPSIPQGVQYCYGSDAMRPRDKKGGPYATAAYLDGSVTVTSTVVEKPEYAHVANFDCVKVVSGSNSSSLSVKCGGASATVAPNDGLTVTSLKIAPAKSMDVTISGHAYIYGVLMDSPKGVAVDNVPMRGSSGEVFANLNRREITDFLAQEKVPLVILQYGTNMIPSINEKNLESSINLLRKQIEFFKEVAPKSCILFIGPGDMTGHKGGQHTYKLLPKFIDMLKSTCLEAGVAYWDMYSVMGGYDSMLSWVKSGLAGKDYVHFTPKGAEHMSEVLSNTILLYYDYYKFRMNPNAK